MIRLELATAYAKELKDSRDIADYIDGLSKGFVDTELIEEMYHGCSATLKDISASKLKEGPKDANIPSAAKEARYAKMKPSTMPPLMVDEGVIVDGNHRFRAGLSKGMTIFPCYVIEGLDDD